MSLCPETSIIEAEPSDSPTETDESTLPDVRLNEMSEPVTEVTKPTLPLAAIKGCARSSSTAEEGSETLRALEIVVRRSLACAATKLSSNKQASSDVGLLSDFTALNSSSMSTRGAITCCEEIL
jgi:hypothetical protein